jgi:hypothetical protein
VVLEKDKQFLFIKTHRDVTAILKLSFNELPVLMDPDQEGNRSNRTTSETTRTTFILIVIIIFTF